MPSAEKPQPTNSPSTAALSTGQIWIDACEGEIDSLARHGAYTEVPENTLPTWSDKRGSASEVISILWVLKNKYNELRELVKAKARAVLDGSNQKRVAAKQGIDLNCFSPSVRHTTHKCLCAAAVCRPTNGLYKRVTLQFDIEGAYLQGELEDQVVYARPPPGFRTHTREGVPIVWKLTGPLYGGADSGRMWNKTLHRVMAGDGGEQKVSLGFNQSEFDPCLYSKCYPDGTRMDIAIYVDDGWVEHDAGPQAEADLKLLAERFKGRELMTFKEPKHFLGMNVAVDLDNSSIELSSQAYVEGMADKYVPDWRSWAPIDMPAPANLRDLYETARDNKSSASEYPDDLLKDYGGKVGSLIYTMPCVRVDAAQPIALCARAITFPTAELLEVADRIIVYLAQTSHVHVRYSGHAPSADVLTAESDSDWAVGHSTTGWAILLAGAVIGFCSKRQPSIALSSTEAEIIAASTCATEVAYFRGLLRELGVEQLEPTVIGVDNSGAVELSRDRKSCHRSRHVDRRYFKVREYVAAGVVDVVKVSTDDNSSDVLTKVLPKDKFIKHVRRLLNIEGSSPPVADASSPLDQEVIKYMQAGALAAAVDEPSDDQKHWARTWKWHRLPGGKPKPCTTPGCAGRQEITCAFYDPSRHDPPRCGAWDCSTFNTASNGGHCDGQLVCDCEEKYNWPSPVEERIQAWYAANNGELPFYVPDAPAPFVDTNNLPPGAWLVTRADGTQELHHDSSIANIADAGDDAASDPVLYVPR